MKKILHITESLGGGVATALRGYVRNTPGHWHFLLAAKRDGAHDSMEWLNSFAGHFELPRTFFPAIRLIRKIYDDVLPDWVHLHSSFAGAYGRLALLPRGKVIYSPHCYAWERRDVSKMRRASYYFAEQMLSAGSSVTAATSPRELELAQRMIFNQHTMLLPNAAFIPVEIRALRQTHRRGERLRIVMAGRISPQKDPGFFLDTVQQSRERNLAADFIWLGGGDEAWEASLREAGVTVTGWLDQNELLREMAQSDVYFHSAAWESCPLSLLEASSLGLMLVCRDSPAIASLPVNPTVPSAKAAVDTFSQIAEHLTLSTFAAINNVLNESYSEEMQVNALSDLYGS